MSNTTNRQLTCLTEAVTNIPNANVVPMFDVLNIDHALAATATVGGSLLTGTGLFTVGVDFPVGNSTVTVGDINIYDANDGLFFRLVDNGIGARSLQNNPVLDFSDCIDGVYDVNFVYQFASGAITGTGLSVTIASGEIQSIVLPGPVSRSYDLCVGKTFQLVDQSGLIGVPFDPAGLPYVPVGALQFKEPELPRPEIALSTAPKTTRGLRQVSCWTSLIFNWAGNVVVGLGVAPGTPGIIKFVREDAAGQCRYTVDGSAPTAINGSQIQGNGNGFNEIPMADLSLFQVVGTAAGSMGSVEVSIYTC